MQLHSYLLTVLRPAINSSEVIIPHKPQTNSRILNITVAATINVLCIGKYRERIANNSDRHGVHPHRPN